MIGALPFIPPSPANPYVGAQATGAARASLQRALDNYKTGHINLPAQPAGSELHRSDTLSFGESHASELSSIASSPGIPSTPPHSDKPLSDAPPKLAEDAPSTQGPSMPINPADLNQAPAAIPTPASGDSGHHSPLADVPTQSNSSNTPTVAETGVPLSAGASGPGPVSGSLLDLKHDAAPGNVPPPAAEAAQRFESAAEEKKRLEAAYSAAPASGQASTSVEVQHESAEEEKKRLEREEREKLLRNPTGHDDGASGKEHDEDLPPYQDM